MKFDLSFWRFVIFLNISKSWTWGKGSEVYLFHIGTFKRNNNTAIKIVVLPFNLMIGFVRRY